MISAYLNGKLDEEIYMQQPEHYCDGTTWVWKLNKALYRLKQSGRVWNQELNSSFLSRGYTRRLSDQCVYLKRNGADITIVAVHVDDMTLLASSPALMTVIETQLESMFNVKKLGPIHQLLGMEVTWDADGSTFLSQSQYLSKILEQFQMHNSTSIAPTHISVDNHSTICFAQNSGFHAHSKQIGV